MPRKLWTKKDDRKYEKILESCRLERKRGRTVADCKRIAAATVNRDRKAGTRGLRGKSSYEVMRDWDDQIRALGEYAKLIGATTIDGALYPAATEEDRRQARALLQEKYPHIEISRRRGFLGGFGALEPAAVEGAIRRTLLEAREGEAGAGAAYWEDARGWRDRLRKGAREGGGARTSWMLTRMLDGYSAAMRAYAAAQAAARLLENGECEEQCETLGHVAGQVEREMIDAVLLDRLER